MIVVILKHNITNIDNEIRYYNFYTIIGDLKMQEAVLRKLFLAFIQIHILHHASIEPIYGTWMIEELEHHGYDISPGTLYPIFHNLEKDGLLISKSQNVNGKTRKYYSITDKGREVFKQAKFKIKELSLEC